MKNRYLILIVAAAMIAILPSCNSSKIKTLIITGPVSHKWTESSGSIKKILDETGLFSSKIFNAPPSADDISLFNPKFSKYGLVVLDYEGGEWNEKANNAFIAYLNNGGGVLVFNSKNDLIATHADSSKMSGRGSFVIRSILADHPVTSGLPVRWIHPADIIDNGIQPAGEEVQILAVATADDQSMRGRRSDPVLLSRNYGKGRIIALMMGNPEGEENQAVHCAGFIVTLQRSAEWAATGAVTQEVPFDFPTAAGAVLRHGYKSVNPDEAFEKMCSYEIGESTLYFTWLQSEIRRASGNAETLLNLEKKMVEVLNNNKSTVEAKKLILKELSWMGTEYCIPAVKELSSVADLKDEVEFALKRLQNSN